MKSLTKRQLEILSFIKSYTQKNSYSPSYREIMTQFEFSSVGSVSKHIDTLKKKGALTAKAHAARSLSLTEEKNEKTTFAEAELSLIGYLCPSMPIETFSKAQKLKIPKFLVHHPEKTYALRTRGDFLAKEMIADGDLLLIEAKREPAEGETILAETKERKVLIKQYFPEGNSIRLCGKSPDTPSQVIRSEELIIHGTLISQLRIYF